MIWLKRYDVVLLAYGIWLCVLTVLVFGWPWQW